MLAWRLSHFRPWCFGEHVACSLFYSLCCKGTWCRMPSWFPMFGRFLGAAKPALKFAEKIPRWKTRLPSSGVWHDGLQKGSWLKFRRWRGKRALIKNMIFTLRWSVCSVDFSQALNDTVFEQLMSEVLNDTSVIQNFWHLCLQRQALASQLLKPFQCWRWKQLNQSWQSCYEGTSRRTSKTSYD